MSNLLKDERSPLVLVRKTVDVDDRHQNAQRRPYERIDGAKSLTNSNMQGVITLGLSNDEAAATNYADDDTAQNAPASNHSNDVLLSSCVCTECHSYRVTVLNLFAEDMEFNGLWLELRKLMRHHYDIIPENAPVHIVDSRRMALNNAALGMKWVGHGHFTSLPLTTSMKLSHDMLNIYLFSMLYRRDPHQMFELVCLHLQSIATAYFVCIKEIIKSSNGGPVGASSSASVCFGADAKLCFDPVKLLNFLLDGYDKMCNASKKMQPMLYELEREHLHPFGLTWRMLNKRIYQRFVYWEVRELIPQCLLMLKKVLDCEQYETIVYRFIEFDDEMTLLAFKWRHTWTQINDYHLGKADRTRRSRILDAYAILCSIKDTDFGYESEVDGDKVDMVAAGNDIDLPKSHKLMAEWLKSSAREWVWRNCVIQLRKWSQVTDPSAAELVDVKCARCKRTQAMHHFECRCRTCILAGSPCVSNSSKPDRCVRCMEFENFDRSYLDPITEVIKENSDEAKHRMCLVYQASDQDDHSIKVIASGEGNPSGKYSTMTNEWFKEHSYHLSWAVFNHLPARRPYTSAKVVRQHFCAAQDPPCTRTECRVASQIIAGVYPPNFAKFLVWSYQTLIKEDTDIINHTHHVYLTYLIAQLNHLEMPDMLNEMRDWDEVFVRDIGAAMAECYITDPPVSVLNKLDQCFTCSGFDIELDLEWLEKIYVNKDRDAESAMWITFCSVGLEAGAMVRVKEMGPSLDKFFLDKTALQQILIQRDKGGLGFDMLGPGAAGFDRSAEDLKLAVNQKLKLQLEEELRTLKEEHSVLKDKVRDLEQMTENEEKHIKTKMAEKPGGAATAHTCSGMCSNAAAEFSCAEYLENKYCHRRDGQCVCYYCTIFGHTEYNYGRFNETRDRLRKRLQQQNAKSTPSTTPTTSVSAATTSSTPPIATTSTAAAASSDAKIQPTEEVKKSPSLAKPMKATAPSLPSSVLEKMLTIIDNDLVTCMDTSAVTQPAPPKVAAPHARPPSSLSSSSDASIVSTPSCSPTASLLQTVSEMEPGRVVLDQATQANLPKPIHMLNKQNPLHKATAPSVVVGQKRKLQTPVVQQTQNVILTPPPPPPPPTTGPPPTVTSAKPPISAATQTTPTPPSSLKKELGGPPHKDSRGRVRITVTKKAALLAQRAVLAAKVAANNSAPIAEEQPVAQVDSPTPSQTARGGDDIDSLLQFIEGGVSKKELQKKAAKKAKQKQKRQDDKKLEELEQLRDEFHEVFYRELDVKTELNQLKGNKKANKKSLTEAENHVKGLNKQRVKLEAVILELIADLKRHNTDFKFAYLPSKEQQLAKIARDKVQPAAVVVMPSSVLIPSAPIIPDPSRISLSNVSVTDDSDPAKQMVTIRRVHTAYASEPQFTITTADKDKLLYRFVDGVLVPESDANSAGLASHSLADVYDKQHRHLRELNLNRTSKSYMNEPLPPYLMERPLVTKKPLAEVTTPSAASSQLTAKQRKKMEKKAARQAAEAAKIEPPVAPRKESVDETCSEATTSTMTRPKAKLTKKQAKKEAKKALTKARNEPKVDDIVEMTRDMCLDEPRSKANVAAKAKKDSPKPQKRRVKATKYEYADPQYAKNKFDVLNMDDDDFESASDTSESVSPVRPARPTAGEPPKHSKDSSFTTVQKTRAEKAKAQKLASQAWNREAKAVLAAKASPVPFNNRPQSPYVRVPAPPQPIEIQMTKKQLKKLAQQQTRIAAQQTTVVPTTHKTTTSRPESQTMAQTLKNSMQKLSLNDDTTIELVRQQQRPNGGVGANGPSTPSVSIIDQLSRGVQMEGLTLPPGITLTRVDPVQAEQIRAKRESIKRICHPMPPPDAVNEHPPSNHFMANQMAAPSQGPNGIIMVDTMKLQPNRQTGPTLSASADTATTQKGRKNQRNKNKTKETAAAQAVPSPQLVTLRNPMFQSNGISTPTSNVSFAPSSAAPPSQHPMPSMHIDQPAAIIKNNNGMFTIRNPALHEAMTQQMPPNTAANGSVFTAYPRNFQHPPPIIPPVVAAPIQQQQPPPSRPHDNYSFFSDHHQPDVQPKNKPSTQAIGSELKHRLQQTAWPQPQQSATASSAVGSISGGGGSDLFNHLNNLNQQQPFARPPPSPYNFNGDFVGSTSNGIASSSSSSVQSFFNNGAAGVAALGGTSRINTNFSSYGNDTSINHGSKMMGLGNASPPPRVNNNFFYGNATDNASGPQNYDDSPFMYNLQPGQRLNNEVTIHNVSESKFHRGEPSINAINGVEITRIPSVGNRPMMGGGAPSPSCSPHLDNYANEQTPLVSLDELHQKALQLELRRQMLINKEAQQLLNTSTPPPLQQQQQQQSGRFGVLNHSNLVPPGFVEPQNRAVGSNRAHSLRQQDPAIINHPQPSSGLNEFGVPSHHRLLSDDTVFAPNQQVSLAELETEEREIESFKRFDYYFKPPTNKPKVCFDIKNIVLAQRKVALSPSPSDHMTQSSSSSSSFYDDMAAAARFNVGGVGAPPLMDNFFSDMSLMSSMGATGGFSPADLDIYARGSHGGHGMGRADHGFGNGMLDGSEIRSGLVD